MKRIVIGSTSVHKIDAVRQACEKLGIDAVVSGFKTASDQNEQPVGFDETYGGALVRALTVKENNKNSIAIGIESGIFRFRGVITRTLDIAVIVILTAEAREIITTTHGIVFPEKDVLIAEQRGFEKTTVGSVIAEHLGGDPTDPHATLTKGKITRMETLVDALVVALKQI